MNFRRCQHSHRMLLGMLMVFAGFKFGSMLATAGVKIVEAPTPAAGTITGEEARQHVQETNTVCGVVASARYAEQSPGKPTYLNFDRPYPEQTFTAIVAESARARFKDAPEVAFTGKNVCITGLITLGHGKPRIMVEDPSQIRITDTAPPTTNQASQGTSK